jgi:hypothetical protein
VIEIIDRANTGRVAMLGDKKRINRF